MPLTVMVTVKVKVKVIVTVTVILKEGYGRPPHRIIWYSKQRLTLGLFSL